MRTLEPLLTGIRAYYETDADLIRIALNTTSWVEANLALQLLSESLPERALVNAANIREAIKELPRCPMAMAVDFERLAQIWHLEREGTAWSRSFSDPEGDYTIVLLGEGNHCYDIVVRTGYGPIMWMPEHSEEDFLHPDIIDLVMERPGVLGTVIDLLQAMGMAFYPMIYLSLDDWHQEYARTIVEEAVRLFSTEAEELERERIAAAAGVDGVGTETRFRGLSDEDGLSWLL